MIGISGLRGIGLSALTVFLLFSGSVMAQEKADVIFVNADVYVGSRFIKGDKGFKVTTLPRAQAIAVLGDRILAVGTLESMKKIRNKKTPIIDLGGKFVMPGFNDAHLHLAAGGFERLNVSLVGTKSLAEMQARIADKVKTAAPGEWIQGRGWDHTKWTDQKLPARHDLDAVTGDHPAIFGRVDGHISVANSAALKLAGITRATKDPTGGKIDRDAKGEPTGILRESPAEDLANSKIPKPTPSQRKRAMQLAFEEAAKWGVTSAQDNSEWEDFLALEDLQRENKLTLRVTEWLKFDDPLDLLTKRRASHSGTDPMLHTGMLKGYMDGSLGSRTAALMKPYSDDPKNVGLPQFEQAKLNELARERVAAGFQLGFHAIGDRAAEMALTAFAEAQRYARENASFGKKRGDWRLRIEHDQVVASEQFAKYTELGVIASMQPNHLLTDMNWAQSRVGPERAKTSYAWKKFLDSGVTLAFGTDFPVETITPLRGLYAAVTRKNEAGTAEYFPEQKLTIDEAIAAYTTGAAYAEFAELDKGTLEQGKLADFVVLDRDITKATPAEILETKILRTVVGGKTVYESGN